MLGAMLSRPLSTVEPVVVIPDIVSEVGVGEADVVDKHKWQGGKRTRDGPNQTGDEEHIAYAEFELGGSTYR